MSSAIAHHASRVTPAQLTPVLAQIEELSARMNALVDLFRLIGEHTTDYAVVQPLSEAGATTANNLMESLYAILNNVGDLSGAHVGAAA